LELLPLFWRKIFKVDIHKVCDFRHLESIRLCPTGRAKKCFDAKSALNANHTASRTKLASHAQRAKDVPVNFS
jgi:hypothetical protein